jgi:hypothetical protein
VGTENNERILISSWKEISVYLNCGIRTCRRWEKEYGLPVHRIEGANKSPVYAYKEELDVWLKKKLNNHRIHLKREIQFSKIVIRKWLMIVLPLFAVLLGTIVLLSSSRKPEPVQWREANIIVSEPRNERLSVWSFDGDRVYVPTMTAKPAKFSRTAMDDVDNDGELEIVALININVKKKKRSRTESKDGSDESDEQKPEKRIYPIVLEKVKTYDWPRFTKSIFESDADYFVGGSWSVMSLAVGDVDEIPGKEIVITSGDRIAIFKYDGETNQVQLIAAREEIIEGARLNLWSVAIDRSSESEKAQIYVSAYLVGRAEISFLLILEMWNDWPVLKRVVQSDTWTVSNPLCIGDVIDGGDREIITARTRRRGDWDNAYILGWNLKGDQLFDFQLYEPQMTRPQFLPIPRMAVGDLTPHPGDEIIITTNLKNQPCELIVYRIEELSLLELSRHRFDIPGSRIRQVFVANLDDDAANEIIIEGYCSSGPKGPICFFLEVFDYDGSLSSIWRKELKSKYVRDVSVSGMISN